MYAPTVWAYSMQTDLGDWPVHPSNKATNLLCTWPLRPETHCTSESNDNSKVSIFWQTLASSKSSTKKASGTKSNYAGNCAIELAICPMPSETMQVIITCNRILSRL